MRNLTEISNTIKIEIRNTIVGQEFSYKGQLKRVLRFYEYWQQPQGFYYLEDFDLATVPVEGPIGVNVRFECWVGQEIDNNSSRKAQIDGTFGPITIEFLNGSYEIDTSSAIFSSIEVG